VTASQEIIEPSEMNAFNNTGLFSNHYLINMIHKISEWGCDDAHLWEIYTQIKEVFDRKRRNFESYVEADLEHNWIRPVLEILGHHFGVQEGLHHDPLKPDYAFFPDQKTLEEAYSKKMDAEDFYKKSIVVGDAKAWNVALDKSRQGKAYREMTNPSFQIDVYLRATPPKWAILTNGRLWRLYHEDTSVKMDCYYEVDLPEIIKSVNEGGKIENFKYFYLFFRLEAFPQIPLGSSFLDRVREESAAYAQKVGNDLQDNVYKAMKILSEGFFSESSNSLSSSAEDVKEVQDNSLRLLYRLLFIFYAESRKLLNTDNKHYREMSLRKMKEDISRKMDQGESILAVRSTYWEGLKDLFRLINDGSEAYGYPKEEFYIPAYNGGLFDPAENPFLAEKRIGNSYLAEAIDLLARSKGENGMAFVDYSSLNIRHLGSIYEGILEYKLHLAEEPMVAIKEKGKEIWLPKREAKNRKISDTVESGRLYLVTDKGERKATGSYYTPEYIVKYIVKNTLAPIIDPMMEGAIWSDDEKKNLLSKLLSIKVLDPAMGSGHFLVEATDYIAREIIHAKEIARREELETEDVAEHDVHWARREVVRNCIYGVDLNPMAVELAKLSLWLTTMAANKPLSFLDHHLRCGNSLIGAELERLTVLPGGQAEQTPLWSFGLKSHTEELLKRYSLMASLPDDNLQMVRWKEEQFRQIKESELSRRLNELSNVWLSTYFGNRVKDDDYYELQNHLSPEKHPDWAGLREQEWFVQAQRLAEEKRFFHWELEFPEAFGGEKRGFDAVIGNPPYVRQESFIEIQNYIRLVYNTFGSRADIYVYFFEKGLSLISINSRLGFIVSNKFMRANYGKNLRKHLARFASIEQILDFGDLDVFCGLTVYPSILIMQKSDENRIKKKDILIYKPNFLNPNELELEIKKRSYKIPFGYLNEDSWNLGPNTIEELISKAKSISKSVKGFCGEPTRGILTGLNDVFLVNEAKKQEIIQSHPSDVVLFKPYVKGLEVQKWTPLAPTEYIIFTQGITIDEYPAVKEYLLRFLDILEARTAVKTIGNKWFELHQIAGYQQQLSSKIVYPSVASGCRFTLNTNGTLVDKTCYFLSSDSKYLLSILNSKLMFFIFKQFGTERRGGYFEFLGQFISKLPIRCISFTTPEDERRRLAEELKGLCAAGQFEKVIEVVGDCLPKNDAGEFVAEGERSDVVHDILAHLAEEMIRMNKEKQDEIKKFLGWLENDMSARVEDLTNKTKIQAYYEIEFPEFLAVLNKNKKKIQVDYSRYDPNSRLLEAFNTSLSRLKPLIAKIEETDLLIDQVVYKLYGLTDEEIKIIEDAVAK